MRSIYLKKCFFVRKKTTPTQVTRPATSIDTLKIDKEFVTGIEPDTRSTKIVEGIISLAHNFGIEVLAEGVETQSQLERLMQIGCDKIQGFFISPPVLAEEIPSLLAQYNR